MFENKKLPYRKHENHLLGRIISIAFFLLLLAGRKKIVLDENQLLDLYVTKEMTCAQIGILVGHSEDLVHRTLRAMEKNMT